ncbi:hypothetical protein Micbo1qcDRAFT_203860 [Microdochium bolleyi]|uniref:Uncharacterized protein n=1 Tax=Microdochium bolleyi TaxID=196109 RepID=A0A136J3J2_9PEZI|nr:hypothetical protein Micbo1qcDRAFT_203860 [Microdochium bolleyi]
MSAHNSSATGAKYASGTGMASSTQTPANSHLGTDKPKAFDEQGAIGKQFTEQGALGGAAQAVGGPLAKDGAIGKQFTTDGAIGGSVQNALGGTKGQSN